MYDAVEVQEAEGAAVKTGAKVPGGAAETYNEKDTVVIAVRIHLFPFRTEKLSSLAPMVLLHQVGE